jgi:hypothetical protein
MSISITSHTNELLNISIEQLSMDTDTWNTVPQSILLFKIDKQKQSQQNTLLDTFQIHEPQVQYTIKLHLPKGIEYPIYRLHCKKNNESFYRFFGTVHGNGSNHERIAGYSDRLFGQVEKDDVLDRIYQYLLQKSHKVVVVVVQDQSTSSSLSSIDIDDLFRNDMFE